MSVSQPTWGDDLEVREYARGLHDSGASQGFLARRLSERLGVTVTKGSVARAIARYDWPRHPEAVIRVNKALHPRPARARPPTRLKKDAERRKVTLPALPRDALADWPKARPVRSPFLDEWHKRCKYLAGELPYVQCKADRLPGKSYCAAHQALCTVGRRLREIMEREGEDAA